MRGVPRGKKCACVLSLNAFASLGAAFSPYSRVTTAQLDQRRTTRAPPDTTARLAALQLRPAVRATTVQRDRRRSPAAPAANIREQVSRFSGLWP